MSSSNSGLAELVAPEALVVDTSLAQLEPQAALMDKAMASMEGMVEMVGVEVMVVVVVAELGALLLVCGLEAMSSCMKASTSRTLVALEALEGALVCQGQLATRARLVRVESD